MKNNIKKNVVIALSGGVDSSVAAKLLIDKGYNVTAVFMQNWDDYLNNNSDTVCSYLEEWKNAYEVSKQLNIKIHKVYFISEYWKKVFSNFLKDIKLGKTPNPDILCNKTIKFKSFSDYVFEKFKPDFIATGHYAEIIQKKNNYYLSKSKDEKKDQTYFLCQINKNILKKVIFPLSNIKKETVREIARNKNLINSEKKDSVGICFIGTKEKKFNKFLSNYIPEKKGIIKDINSNKELGEHNGLHFFTIGQRKGINIKTSTNKSNAYFVVSKEHKNNILFVTNIYNDEKLYSNSCNIIKFNWLIEKEYIEKIIINKINITAKLRSQQQEIIVEKILYQNKYKHNIYIEFKYKQKSVTPGQYIVLYDSNICLGGGIIKSTDKINENSELI